MSDLGVVSEDKVVTQLEQICEEVEKLRKNLAEAGDRIRFLEERIAGGYNFVFQETVKTQSYR